MQTTTESASTPISKGGWRYDPDDPQDVADHAEFTAVELRDLETECGFDFAAHPALALAEQEPAEDHPEEEEQ